MGTSLELDTAQLVREEKAVLGSYYGSCDPARDLLRYAELFREGKLALDGLVTRRWQLDQIAEAYASLLAGEGARGVVVF